MNDEPDSPPESDDDLQLYEALSHLKRLEPPLETRIANRLAVAAELGPLSALNSQRRLPWWRRSISVPVPLAAAAALLTAVALPSSFRNWSERSPVQVAAPSQSAKVADDAARKATAIARLAPGTHAELKYYETETYLCGVGRLQSETGYLARSRTYE